MKIVLCYIIIIIICAIKSKVNIFNSFTKGVKESYKILFNLFPSILFFIFAINILTNSGIIELLQVFCERLKIIPEVFIQLILRPLSGSSSLLMMINVFNKYGVDTFLGKLSSVIQASSDTTIYIIILYFTTLGIKKIGKCLLICLLCNLLIFIVSIVVSCIFFGIF